jgi:phosphoribosylaminoimidazole synthetase
VVNVKNGFGGLCRVPGAPKEILVTSTDSVGSKTEFIRGLCLLPGTSTEKCKQLISGLGRDIVNHCVNDMMMMGCMTPLTFLDYYATHSLNQFHFQSVIDGLCSACSDVGCSLIGGETAEISLLYRENAVDLAGFITGVMSDEEMLTPISTITTGDICIAIPSVSPHTNGYTLINKIFKSCTERNLGVLGEVDVNWFMSLATPHKCYLSLVRKLRIQQKIPIKGMAHITGGGLIDNPPRVIGDNLSFEFDLAAIKNHMSPEFVRLWQESGIAMDNHYEIMQTFNCGVGLILIQSIEASQQILETVSDAFVIGRIIERGSAGPVTFI